VLPQHGNEMCWVCGCLEPEVEVAVALGCGFLPIVGCSVYPQEEKGTPSGVTKGVGELPMQFCFMHIY
jgi:hypothetical protein